MYKKSPLIIICFLFFIISCNKDDIETLPTTDSNDPTDPTSVSNPEREKAVKDYQDNFLGSAVSNPGWTGDVNSCKAGSVPTDTHNKVAKRINYFRRMVGLNDNITLDPSKFEMLQKSSLIFLANRNLSHTPPNTWKCWTEDGKTGAGISNISYGNHSVNAVFSQMRDDGANNIHVGHRRWILYSKATQFSHGSTSNSMSLGVLGFEKGNTKVPEYIAYPPKGYVPQKLIFNRWSFSIPKAIFKNAKVSMSGPNGNIPLTVVSRNKTRYADNTIVWEPQNITKNSEKDVEYTITISDVENTPKTTYTYKVTIIKV